MRFLLLFAMLCVFIETCGAKAQQKTGPSGNPLPRFVSTASNEANMRTGPGLQYPIMWHYQWRGLPLEVVDENGSWRRVRDRDGTEGWMHVSLLSSKRQVIITGRAHRLYKDPQDPSTLSIIAEEGSIASLKKCENGWCQLEAEGRTGWIDHRFLWGVYNHETLK